MIRIALLIAAVYFLFAGIRSLLIKDPAKRSTARGTAIVMLVAGVVFLLVAGFFEQFLDLVLG